MHLLIINCSPRAMNLSNTEKILTRFKEGFCIGDNTAQTFQLSNRQSWDAARDAFMQAEDILFALPLFVECIPGIMIEFLDTLDVKPLCADGTQARMSFLVQGGFPEACQLRCCESYVKTLPAYFNCVHKGTLIKGDMFGGRFVPADQYAKLTAPFTDMGKSFAENGGFDAEKTAAFAGPEQFGGGVRFIVSLMFPVQRAMFKKMAKTAMGCETPLDQKVIAID